MENCVSKEIEGDNTIEIIKKVYQTILLIKKGLMMWFMTNGVRTS